MNERHGVFPIEPPRDPIADAIRKEHAMYNHGYREGIETAIRWLEPMQIAAEMRKALLPED